MAKLEIPSIVVQSGSHTPPSMDRATRRTQWSLSTQNTTYEEENDLSLSSKPTEQEQSKTTMEKEDAKPEVPHNTTNNNVPPQKSKLCLLRRSHAITESTSPPPDISFTKSNPPTSPTSDELPTTQSSNINNNYFFVNNNNQSNPNNGSLSTRPSIKREGSTESNYSSLSRSNSVEQTFTDQKTQQFYHFLIDILSKNPKHKATLLKIENDLVNFANDTRKNVLKFEIMTSYQRRLVHKVAEYLGIEHNTDPTGQMVVVTKGKNTTKLPDIRIDDLTRDYLLLSEEPRKLILKRDSASFEETVTFKSPDRHSENTPRRSKSFEEREEEYEKVRRRIFHQEHEHNEQESNDGEIQDESELNWSQMNNQAWQNQESDSTKLHPLSHRPSRLTKVESYESRDKLKANSLRSSVGKSLSFGGYDHNSSNSRVLTKQDSGSSVSSRVSPSSSSGYKSQSQRSDTTMSATPSPTATPHLASQLSNQSGALSPEPEQEPTVLWAVTNLASVPIGSVLINPETGQPYTNEDGSVYHYDPENPPKFGVIGDQLTTPRQPFQPDPPPDQRSNLAHVIKPQAEAGSSATLDTPAQNQVQSSSESRTFQETQIKQEPEARPIHMGQINPLYQGLHPPPIPVPMTVTSQPPVNNHGYGPALHYISPTPAHFVVRTTESYPASQSNQQGLLYNIPQPNPPYTAVPQAYDRIPVEGGTQELCGYLMGLGLGEVGRAEAAHHPVFYCPSASTHPHPATHQSGHFSQSAMPGPPVQGATVYFTPSNPAPQGPPPPGRFPCAYNQFQSADMSAGECRYTQPAQAYFPRCPTNAQVGAAPNYCSTNGSSGNMMGIVMPPAPLQVPPPAPTTRPYHQMSTPPNTPQNGGPQYPLYNNGYATVPGCYPQYQANPPPQVPLAPMIRPALQLNIASSPPLRAVRAPAYNAARSPVVRDPVPSENPQCTTTSMHFTTTPNCIPAAIYRFTYPSSEFILLGTRSPFNSLTNARYPPAATTHARRCRLCGLWQYGCIGFCQCRVLSNSLLRCRLFGFSH